MKPLKMNITLETIDKTDLQNYLHDLAGALDMLEALATILRSNTPLESDKRRDYAKYLEEAKSVIVTALRDQVAAVEKKVSSDN